VPARDAAVSGVPAWKTTPRLGAAPTFSATARRRRPWPHVAKTSTAVAATNDPLDLSERVTRA
jgi:hypothetical protein